MRKLTFILGCTGCGKAAVGQELGRRLGAQLLSVDSMKIYRRMDIGTAKPTADIQAEIPHHGIDIVEPSDSYSVAEYVRCADAAIETIYAAGSLPLAVGGTSLYIKALSEGLFEGPSANPEIRAALKDRIAIEGLAALHDQLATVDPETASRVHRNDERRIVRALEVFQLSGTPISQLQKQWDSDQQRYDCRFIGLRRDKADQSGRINRRVMRMIDAGLKDEVAALLAEPDGLSKQAAAAVGYAEWLDHFHGELTADDVIERIKINTRQLAKKQRTWQRRFQDVQWFDIGEDDTAADIAERILTTVHFNTNLSSSGRDS